MPVDILLHANLSKSYYQSSTEAHTGNLYSMFRTVNISAFIKPSDPFIGVHMNNAACHVLNT